MCRALTAGQLPDIMTRIIKEQDTLGSIGKICCACNNSIVMRHNTRGRNSRKINKKDTENGEHSIRTLRGRKTQNVAVYQKGFEKLWRKLKQTTILRKRY